MEFNSGFKGLICLFKWQGFRAL